ncbi:hypothetical protein ACFL2G_00735 [Candidatus Omnitrophota bacterium]
MSEIGKGYSVKVVSVAISLVLLFMDIGFTSSHIQNLRLPLGQLDKAEEKNRKIDNNASVSNGFSLPLVLALQEYEKNIYTFSEMEDNSDRESKLVFEYDKILRSLAAEGYLDGVLIYPFMGSDLLPAKYFIETIPINDDAKDFKRGEKIIKRVYKKASEEIIALIRSRIRSRKALDVMKETTYLNQDFLKSDRPRFVFLLKCFDVFSDEYPEEVVQKVLRVVLEQVLQKGDRILVLHKKDVSFIPTLKKAGFSCIAEYYPSSLASELTILVQEGPTAVTFPDVFVVMEKLASGKKVEWKDKWGKPDREAMKTASRYIKEWKAKKMEDLQIMDNLLPGAKFQQQLLNDKIKPESQDAIEIFKATCKIDFDWGASMLSTTSAGLHETIHYMIKVDYNRPYVVALVNRAIELLEETYKVECKDGVFNIEYDLMKFLSIFSPLSRPDIKGFLSKLNEKSIAFIINQFHLNDNLSLDYIFEAVLKTRPEAIDLLSGKVRKRLNLPEMKIPDKDLRTDS